MTITWRCPPSVTMKEKGLVRQDRREYFMRRASLDRLKQFPAYLCTRSSVAFPNVLLFLNAALSAVQFGLKNFNRLLKRYYQAGTVVAALFVLFLQFAFCSIIFCMEAKPPGMLFMIASLLIMAVIAYRTFINETPTNRISRGRHY